MSGLLGAFEIAPIIHRFYFHRRNSRGPNSPFSVGNQYIDILWALFMDAEKNGLQFINVTVLNFRKSCQYSAQQFGFVGKNFLLRGQTVS